MRKVYYIYNPKTRTYDRIYPTVRQRALSILRRLFVGMGLGAGSFIILLFIFGSPSEKELRIENARLLAQYNVLSHRLDEAIRFRNTLVVRNSLKVLAFSVAFCILFLVAVLGMSRFFSRTVINWNSYESYYYLCEGCISNVGFAKVVMKTFVCLLIPTIFFSELICAFGCIINKVFPFLVTVTTCIAVSFDGDWNIDFWLLIFGTIIVFVLNLLFMKRKDFLN